MKKLGLVGGMGVESTIPYYHDIDEVCPIPSLDTMKIYTAFN